MLDRVTIERMAAEAGEGPILIALSGGGDSTALLHLLSAEFGARRIRALVVDHALREGSAADAARAASFAHALVVGAEVLTLTWSNGPQHSQEVWRQARYAALCRRARELRSRVIAVAHSADDQLETLMMRTTAGSGERGLAGMAAFAPAPLWPEGRGVWIARPLLGVRREALRSYLRERSAVWIEDPANSNLAFERIRVRQQLAEQEAAGDVSIAQLLDGCRRLRAQAGQIDADAYALVTVSARFEADAITLDPAQWRGEAEVRRRGLSALIAAAGGAAREPPARGVTQLEAKLTETGFSGATLGGALLSLRGGAVRITRDPGAVIGRAGVPPLAPLSLRAGITEVWDGRLEVTAQEEGWCIVVEGGQAVVRHAAFGGERPGPRARWLLRQHAAHALGRVE